MSDFQISASLHNLNQYCSSRSELECPAVDATWIETTSKKAALKVIYYYHFDEQSLASFPELLLKGDISQSVHSKGGEKEKKQLISSLIAS